MSAVNTNLSDREHEALRRAQRAHEPSMEEILASIRTIIAEERDPAKISDLKAATAKPAAPQVVYTKAEPATLRTPAQPTQRSEPAAEPNPPKVVWAQSARGPEAAETPDPSAGDGPLLSIETEKAVASAFEDLSASVAARSVALAEGMAREMLRPMLKAWLDENLPGIVERLVRAEIERVTRGGR
jgi:cell pole-organizing protein PopZ